MGKINKINTVYYVQLALLAALLAIFAFTPLGYLKITPAIGATLAHVPVIIAAIVLGKRAGILMGSLLGVFSFIAFTFIYPADLMAPAFSPFAENAVMGKSWLSLIIVLVPRILLGYFTAVIFSFFDKKTKIKRPLSATLAAAVGTALHSFMVLSLIYIIFGSVYSEGQKFVNFIIAWAGVNCLLEIAVAAVVSAAIVVPLKKIIEYRY